VSRRHGGGRVPPSCFFSLTYQLVLFVVDFVHVRTRSDALSRAEVLAIRHQLRLLECGGRQACLAPC